MDDGVKCFDQIVLFHPYFSSVLPSSIAGTSSSREDMLDDEDTNINCGNCIGTDKTSAMVPSGISNLVFLLLSVVRE